MKASRVTAGGPWRGLVRSRAISLRGVRELLAQIFATKTEQGLALDFADLTDEKLAWRRNLFSETEFRNGLANLDTRNAVTVATLAGYAGAIGFPASSDAYAYKQVNAVAGQRYWLSVIVKMDDGGAPAFGSPTPSTAANDFVLVVRGDATGPNAYTVTALGDGFYRVACTYVAYAGGVGNWGIVKYAANSSRTFKATAYMLERAPSLTPYQALTDVHTEFLAAFPTHSLFQDNAGTQAVWSIEQPIGLALDLRLGTARGAEVNPDPGFNNAAAWTTSGATPGWSVANGVASITATASANRWLNSTTQLVVGRYYEVYFDLTVSAGGVLPDISATPVFATTSGRKHWILRASTTTLALLAQPAFIGTVDNLTVREIASVNHALQGTTGDRPIASGRFNQLLASEVLTAANWQKAAGCAAVDNTDTGPDGVQLGTLTGVAATTAYVQQANLPSPTGATCTISLLVKAGTSAASLVRIYNGGVSAPLCGVIVNWSGGVGTIGTTLATWTTAPTLEATSVAGVYRLTGQFSSGTNTTLAVLLYPSASNTADTSKFGGISLTYGSAPRAYQRVGTVATDYDAIGFPKGAKFNGTNSWMQVPTLALDASDKVLATVSMRRDNDAATSIVIEHGTNSASVAGTFGMFAPSANATAGVGWRVLGASGPGVLTAAAAPAPSASVVTGLGDLSGNVMALRNNGAQLAIDTSARNGGTFTNQPFYIGRRAGTSLPFNGVIERVTVRGTDYTNVLGLVERHANEPIRALT
jgi:hypothetical protein